MKNKYLLPLFTVLFFSCKQEIDTKDSITEKENTAIPIIETKEEKDSVFQEKIKDTVAKVIPKEKVKTSYFVRKKGSNYSVLIPNTYSVTSVLNEKAEFQYSDLINERFVFVLKDDKKSFQESVHKINPEVSNEILRVFSEVEVLTMKDHFESYENEKWKNKTINGLPAKIYTVKVLLKGMNTPVQYKNAYIEGENHLYSLITWTTDTKDKKNKKVEEEFQKIIDSFIETN